MGKRLSIEPNMIFGNLTVVKEIDSVRIPSGQVNRMIECKCTCGKIKNIRLAHLYNLKTKSCGCLYNYSNGDKEREYIRIVWRSIKHRTSPTNKGNGHQHYYEKGIRMCYEWLSDFELFYKWAITNGLKKGLQIDRIDNEKGYYAENCRVVTCIENANNKTTNIYVTYKGQREALTPLLRKLNKLNHIAAITARIKRGWGHETAIDKPIREHKEYKPKTAIA